MNTTYATHMVYILLYTMLFIYEKKYKVFRCKNNCREWVGLGWRRTTCMWGYEDTVIETEDMTNNETDVSNEMSCNLVKYKWNNQECKKL